MQDLTVALVQRELAWEDAEANRELIAADLEAVEDGTDLIVLPETFTTGFSMQPEAIAEEAAADTLPWMRQLAAASGAAVTGSLAVREDGMNFNRMLFSSFFSI